MENFDETFYITLATPFSEFAPEYEQLLQVQNVSGELVEIVDGVYMHPRTAALVHPNNSFAKKGLDRKRLKLRSFTVSSDAAVLTPAEPAKKKKRAKGRSGSSLQELEGAVADLAAVISAEPVADLTVATEAKNVEQLVDEQISVVEVLPSEEPENQTSTENVSPETDVESV